MGRASLSFSTPRSRTDVARLRFCHLNQAILEIENQSPEITCEFADTQNIGHPGVITTETDFHLCTYFSASARLLFAPLQIRLAYDLREVVKTVGGKIKAIAHPLNTA